MGKTILISSHILTELSDICSSVAILEKGKLVASGSIDTIKQHLQPGAVYKLELLDGADLARAALLETPGVSNVQGQDGALQFSFTGGREQVPALVKALVAKDLKITGLQEMKTDLEGLFMQLTKGEVA